MKILISAAEASSDTHAALLLSRLKELEPGLQAFGVGGPKLRAQGLEALVRAEELLAMGFVEVLSRLPKIKGQLDLLEREARERRPDVAVVCDYPDFHFKLAARLKALGIPVVCYIPPKVWAWRKGRIRTMASLYSRVLSILPFEEKTYAGTDVRFEYVGNPLVEELPVGLTRSEARARLDIPEGAEALLLMVGSRPSEIRFHLETLIEAAARVKASRPSTGDFRVLIPLPETAERGVVEARLKTLPAAAGLEARVSYGDAWTAMKACDAGIVKSGTSSLEAAVLDLPHVVVYRAHPVSQWIFRLFVRYAGSISLTNLISAEGGTEKIVPELVLADFTPERMTEETLKLLPGGSAREACLRAFASLRERLRARGEAPSLRAAKAVLELGRGKGRG
jgi:lipid-A-disaccharide synthase